MTYDPARGRVVLFGGENSKATYGDIWEWDGTTWTLRAASSGPIPRWGLAMVYDPVRGHVVLYGGGLAVNGGIADFSDTWEFDGAQISAADTAGSRRMAGSPSIRGELQP